MKPGCREEGRRVGKRKGDPEEEGVPETDSIGAESPLTEGRKEFFTNL